MARLICLACSFRPGGYCVAGIDPESGRWVRPVSGSSDRAITLKMMAIDSNMPELLDVLEVPLANTGPDEGCQPENRLVLPGPWRRVDKAAARDMLRYCEDDIVILHNHKDRVPHDYFSTLPRVQWKSLQLVRNSHVQFEPDYRDTRNWRAHFRDGSGHHLTLKVTDPLAGDFARRHQDVNADCLLTVSLGAPWQPDDKSKPLMCYKLVAGVLQL